MSIALAATGLVLGGVVPTVAGLVMQAAGTGSDLGPWVSGGGTATTVALLGYLFKQFLSGNLVSRPIAQVLNEQATMLAAMADREDKSIALAVAAHRREERYEKKIEDANRVLWKVEPLLAQMAQPRRKP